MIAPIIAPKVNMEPKTEYCIHTHPLSKAKQFENQEFETSFASNERNHKFFRRIQDLFFILLLDFIYSTDKLEAQNLKNI